MCRVCTLQLDVSIMTAPVATHAKIYLLGLRNQIKPPTYRVRWIKIKLPHGYILQMYSCKTLTGVHEIHD